MRVALVNPHWDFARSIYVGWAHTHDLVQVSGFSDIQDERPMPLPELELACCPAH